MSLSLRSRGSVSTCWTLSMAHPRMHFPCGPGGIDFACFFLSTLVACAQYNHCSLGRRARRWQVIDYVNTREDMEYWRTLTLFVAC